MPSIPTELVFALDTSRTLTLETFELMREIIIAIVSEARIRDSNCPVGARGARCCFLQLGYPPPDPLLRIIILVSQQE